MIEMKITRTNQTGSIDPLLIPLAASVILIFISIGFGAWSYINYTDQRDNVNKKIDIAINESEAVLVKSLEADFAEREKNPYLTYKSGSDLGSIVVTYPRTWSALVDESGTGTQPLNATFHPRFVSEDNDALNALRLQVVDKDYAKEVDSFARDVEKGIVTVQTIKISGIVGLRIDGEIDRDIQGAMVLLPLRDKTIKLWTEIRSFEGDFTNIVLANLQFDP